MVSAEEPAKQFTVSIVGGGIGGLILAIGLARRNVPVKVYEAAKEFGEIGLGLSLGPAAHRCLPLIDSNLREIYDSLITTHADSLGYEEFRQTWFEIVWCTGDEAGEVLMDLKALPSGQTTVRRADFLDGLIAQLPEGVAHFGKRLLNYEETDTGVTLRFEDGTSVAADVVIGCDGIKSKVKESMFPDILDSIQPQYSGMYCYRAVLDMDTMVEAVGDKRAKVSTLYIDHGAYGISYPIMRGKKVNVGLYLWNESWEETAWVRAATKKDMERDFGSRGDHIRGLIKVMSDATQWGLFDHPHLPTFCKSRVAIIGDAAHASTPHQGAGAGQAIEDAHVLSELLADPKVVSSCDIPAALEAYDQIRRPRSQQVVSSSVDNALLLCLMYDGVLDDGDKLKETWQSRFRWLWDIDVNQQVEDARAILHEKLLRHENR